MVMSAAGIRRRYAELSPVLDERGRRRFAATEARAYGYGGVSIVSRITGMARSTIGRGIEEIEAHKQVETGLIRKPGGGRKSKCWEDSTLLPDLKRLVEPATRGDPMRALLWTSKSLRHLSQALQSQGHSICPHTVAAILQELASGYKANRKPIHADSHIDRY